MRIFGYSKVAGEVEVLPHFRKKKAIGRVIEK